MSSLAKIKKQMQKLEREYETTNPKSEIKRGRLMKKFISLEKKYNKLSGHVCDENCEHE